MLTNRCDFRLGALLGGLRLRRHAAAERPKRRPGIGGAFGTAGERAERRSAKPGRRRGRLWRASAAWDAASDALGRSPSIRETSTRPSTAKNAADALLADPPGPVDLRSKLCGCRRCAEQWRRRRVAATWVTWGDPDAVSASGRTAARHCTRTTG